MSGRRFGKTWRQSGWTLLEMAIGLVLVGVIAVVVLGVMQGTDARLRADAQRLYVDRAEDAVYGAVLRLNRFPAPDNAVPSPGRPGFVEGWFPGERLGFPARQRLRYLVDSTLVDLPVAVYQADPLRLARGAVSGRTGVNGLDFCLALVRREQSGAALPGGSRLGFALQQVVGRNPTGQTDRLWLDDGAAGPLPDGVQTFTRASGYLGAATELGCFAKLAELSTAVRSTAVASDALKLAEEGVAFRQLALKSSKENLLNKTWRLGNWSTGIGTYGIDVMLTGILATQAGWAGRAVAATNIAALALVIAGVGVFINQTVDGIEAAHKDVAMSETVLGDAEHYRDSLQGLLSSEAARANQLQNRGLQP